MKKAGKDISYNPRENNKKYDRTVYHCKTDDVWVVTEIPKHNSNNQTDGAATPRQ